MQAGLKCETGQGKKFPNFFWGVYIHNNKEINTSQNVTPHPWK